LVVGDETGILLEETAGRLSLDADSSAVQPDTIYDVASLTKVVVTTTLVMMLFEEGRLDLDASLGPFTLRQLLTHSAGLPAEPPANESGAKPAYSSNGFRKLPLQYTPGDKTLYSDVGFIILGHIIEDIAAAPLDILARDRIFQPLGMTGSCFNPAPALRYRIAPTGQNTCGVVHDPAAAAMGGVAGHAGLFSTARDLALFCRMMLRGGKTIELFTRRDGAVAGSTRALGWDTPSESGSSSGRYFSKESFGHTGFTGTSMWIDPKRRLYVVFLTNRVLSDRGNSQIRDIRPKLHDAVMLSVSGTGVKR
jgi:CubicO group peptidase (beta-lactamase class C family)